MASAPALLAETKFLHQEFVGSYTTKLPYLPFKDVGAKSIRQLFNLPDNSVFGPTRYYWQVEYLTTGGKHDKAEYIGVGSLSEAEEEWNQFHTPGRLRVFTELKMERDGLDDWGKWSDIIDIKAVKL